MSHDDPIAKGRFLDADHCAIILAPDGNIELCVADRPSTAAPGHRLFVAILFKLHDPEWVEHMLDSLKSANLNPHKGLRLH